MNSMREFLVRRQKIKNWKARSFSRQTTKALRLLSPITSKAIQICNGESY